MAFAIEHDDAKRIATIPGIGPKTASRIVLELKGKVDLDRAYEPAVPVEHVDAAIEDALRALGYARSEIREALRDAQLPSDESEALRSALQLLRRS